MPPPMRRGRRNAEGGRGRPQRRSPLDQPHQLKAALQAELAPTVLHVRPPSAGLSSQTARSVGGRTPRQPFTKSAGSSAGAQLIARSASCGFFFGRAAMSAGPATRRRSGHWSRRRWGAGASRACRPGSMSTIAAAIDPRAGAAVLPFGRIATIGQDSGAASAGWAPPPHRGSPPEVPRVDDVDAASRRLDWPLSSIRWLQESGTDSLWRPDGVRGAAVPASCRGRCRASCRRAQPPARAGCARRRCSEERAQDRGTLVAPDRHRRVGRCPRPRPRSPLSRR